jgi:hypothetical protein
MRGKTIASSMLFIKITFQRKRVQNGHQKVHMAPVTLPRKIS